jgi:hypothetical protein
MDSKPSPEISHEAWAHIKPITTITLNRVIIIITLYWWSKPSPDISHEDWVLITMTKSITIITLIRVIIVITYIGGPNVRGLPYKILHRPIYLPVNLGIIITPTITLIRIICSSWVTSITRPKLWIPYGYLWVLAVYLGIYGYL